MFKQVVTEAFNKRNSLAGLSSSALYLVERRLHSGQLKLNCECPKKVARLIDLVNLPTPLRSFSGHSQMSHLSFFIAVWTYIKQNNLQDASNKNIVNCDDKLKSILLGKPQVELADLPTLVKLHFPN